MQRDLSTAIDSMEPMNQRTPRGRAGPPELLRRFPPATQAIPAKLSTNPQVADQVRWAKLKGALHL